MIGWVYRKFVQTAEIEDVGAVKFSQALVETLVERIGARVAVLLVGRGVVDGFGELIVGENRQARAEAALQRPLQGMVGRVAHRLDDRRRAEARLIRAALIGCGRGRSWRIHRGIELARRSQARALRAGVGKARDESRGQLPLHGQVPALDIRIAEIRGVQELRRELRESHGAGRI